VSLGNGQIIELLEVVEDDVSATCMHACTCVVTDRLYIRHEMMFDIRLMIDTARRIDHLDLSIDSFQAYYLCLFFS
jgi:hypothetical protein